MKMRSSSSGPSTIKGLSRREMLIMLLTGGTSFMGSGALAAWLLSDGSMATPVANQPKNPDEPEIQAEQSVLSSLSGKPMLLPAKNSSNLHVIFFDSSDPVSSHQSEQIDYLSRIEFIKPIKQHDDIAVVQLTDNEQSPITLAHTATDPGGATDANPLLETPVLKEQKRNQEFLRPYYDVLSRAQVPVRKDYTPLLAGLHSLSRHHQFRGGIGHHNAYAKRRLLLITDALEHATISAYQGNLYGRKGRRYVTDYLADLQGVDVTVGLIRRPAHQAIQTPRHKEWFTDFLQRSGALSIRYVDILS